MSKKASSSVRPKSAPDATGVGEAQWTPTRVALLAMACREILHFPDCSAAAPSTFPKKHSTNNMV